MTGDETRILPPSGEGAVRQGPDGVHPPADHGDVAELYRLLVETVVDYAIFVLDATGHIRSWNPGAERLKGYRADEIIGKHFSIFYPEVDLRAGKPQRELEIASATGRVEDEGWRLRKDGSRFWANVVITALRDRSGELVGFAKVTRDLTARRNAEEQARQLAAESAARAEAERQSAEMSRLNEELQRQALELEAQTEEAQSLTEEVELANEQLQTLNGELQGALHDAEEARRVARGAEDSARYLARASEILGASLDYERTLNDLARLVVPHLADWCVVHVVTEAGETRQVAVAHVDSAKVNEAKELSERYPTDPDAAYGVPNVIRTGKPELHAEVPDELLVSTARNPEHLRLIRALGLQSAMIVPLRVQDRVLGALTLVSSESGRRYGDAELTFAQELARRAAFAVENARLHRLALEANAAKTRFLAVMSHELRTPLNAIGGYAELLRMGIRGPVTPDQVEDLDRIMRSERTLLSFINDILNYARLESGHVQFTTERVRVRELVADLESLVSPQIQAKQIQFAFAECDKDLMAHADPDKVRQILVNLLSNAIKFTPADGRIEVQCREHGATVQVLVRDTGVGIPAEKLNAIFEPFVQLDRTLTSTQEGSGLGLSISRDLARGMGGDLCAESTPPSGSTFILTLPRVE